MNSKLSSRLLAEFLGTCLLVSAVVGSGIMGERLAAGNVALALLANTLATGAILVAIILAFQSVSADFNPAVTLAKAISGDAPWREVAPYIAAQLSGGISGAVVGHLMFGLPWYSIASHNRAGAQLAFSEFVATFGLVLVIFGCRTRQNAVAFAVASYIVAAYWFTASTSFANPAVTLARSLSDTFAGIRPHDVPLFVAMQFLGALAATLLSQKLLTFPHPDFSS